jgi:hypothetical protein
MRPACNFEPKHMVTMSTREEWTKGPRAPHAVQEPIWNTDESKKQKATGAGVFGQSFGRSLSISIGRYTTVFQAAKTYASLARVYDIQQITRSEKYISICSASQAALKVLRAVRITSPLVRKCQRH